MPNWTAITINDLMTKAYASVITAAQAQAGTDDPVAEEIADAVATVRAAISQGNVLDIDPTKVPNSLRGLTVRRAAFALMSRIGYELNQDQRDTRAEDKSYLNRIIDSKIRFELADVPAGSAEMQPGRAIETIEPGNRGNDRRELRGL